MHFNKYYLPKNYGKMLPYTLRRMETEEEPLPLEYLYMFPENLPNALNLMRDAISGEYMDRLFYTYLIENAPNVEEKNIITSIRDNEIKHFDMFHQIFYDITGEMIPALEEDNEIQFNPPASYCEGLKQALYGEQNAIQKYRQILFAMQSRVHINMLTEIITDEIRHGSLYNYLYAKNGCNT